MPFRPAYVLLLPTLLLLALPTGLSAADWPAWRGPGMDGVSDESGLITDWDAESGENVIWRVDFTGRSTPVVLGGRVFVIGRAGEKIEQREVVAAYDAEDGEKLWERIVPVANTTVPYNRAGWASLAGDRETGYVYTQGIAGPLICYDRDGEIVWQRHLGEEFGRFSGYGGRTTTPLVDEDRLIVSIINSAWGELGAPRHRYYAFDKRTGDVLWVSTPGKMVYDRNTQAHGVVAVVDGRRLFIAGNADGHIYALEARTGKKVWGFELSKRGINSTPVVAGNTVFVGHSEENLDEGTLGRTVAIDATGTGDVTKTHEKWRQNEIKMGFPSGMVHDGVLYAVDNSAKLYAVDAETGEIRWIHDIGTVGKASPVWADGKIYVTETNGLFHIIQPGEAGAETLDEEFLSMPSGRYAEVYGSPAIAYGRIYFATEEGLYALGNAEREFEVTPSAAPEMAAERSGSDQPATLLVVPGDLTVGLGDRIDFQLRAFNELGRPLGTVAGEWSVDGLQGTISSGGSLALASEGPHQAGHVRAKAGELEASARMRVFGPLPYRETFDDIEGRGRPYWLGAGRYQVTELEGEKVLEKPLAPAGLLRSHLLIGPHELSDYTIQAEVMGNQKGRRRTDVGVIANGYIFDLLGNSQKLQIRTWTAELRMAKTIDYDWEMGKWYVMKLSVQREGEKSIIRGKVWPRGEPEPESWTLTAEDPLPVPSGAPGVLGYSPASAYYDNIEVRVN